MSFGAVENSGGRLGRHFGTGRVLVLRFAKQGMALQTVGVHGFGVHGLAELIRRIEQKRPLDLTPEQIHSFIELGCLLERQAHAEDNVGDEN